MIKNIFKIFLSILISGFIYPTKSDFLSKKECKESIEKELKDLITTEKTQKRQIPIWSKNILDINNDKKKEILITRTDGGNLNAPYLEMIYFNSNCVPKKYELNEIISGDSIFCATGITSGDLVSGIDIKDNEWFATRI